MVMRGGWYGTMQTFGTFVVLRVMRFPCLSFFAPFALPFASLLRATFRYLPPPPCRVPCVALPAPSCAVHPPLAPCRCRPALLSGVPYPQPSLLPCESPPRRQSGL